jgi:hypothetical protein
MLKRDYLLKQIEEFGKVLAQALSYKKEHNYLKYELELSLALKKFSDQNLIDLENQDIEEFQTKLTAQGNLDLSQKKIIATVLFEKMTYYEEHFQYKHADNLKMKCVLLYEDIQMNGTENEYDLDVHYKLSYLRKMND